LSFYWEIFDSGAVLGHFDAMGKIKVQQIIQELYHCVHWFGFLQVAVSFNVIHDVRDMGQEAIIVQRFVKYVFWARVHFIMNVALL
jgi:hypothetical protein